MKTLDDDRLRNLAANNDLWREEVAKSMNEADLSLSVRQSASSSKHFNSTFSFSIFYYLDLDSVSAFSIIWIWISYNVTGLLVLGPLVTMHVVVRKWLRVMYEGVWCQSPEARPTIPNHPRALS